MGPASPHQSWSARQATRRGKPFDPITSGSKPAEQSIDSRATHNVHRSPRWGGWSHCRQADKPTRTAALNGRRRVRYHAPFDGTRGSEPSRVAPCPRVTRRALTRRACWDSHHGRRSAVTTIGSLRSVHAVPQSARSSAPFDPGVGSILPFGRLGCPNRRVRYQTRRCWSETSPQMLQGQRHVTIIMQHSRATQGRRMAPIWACPGGSDTPDLRLDRWNQPRGRTVRMAAR